MSASEIDAYLGGVEEPKRTATYAAPADLVDHGRDRPALTALPYADLAELTEVGSRRETTLP